MLAEKLRLFHGRYTYTPSRMEQSFLYISACMNQCCTARPKSNVPSFCYRKPLPFDRGRGFLLILLAYPFVLVLFPCPLFPSKP